MGKRGGAGFGARSAVVATSAALALAVGPGATLGTVGAQKRGETGREDQRPEIVVEVHEAYELANVAVALHPFVDEREWLALREGAYWEEVARHFAAFRDHPAVRGIPLSESTWVDGYYSVRNGAYRWVFDGRTLVRGDHPLTWRHDGFDPLRRDFEDLARLSGFRDFFRRHQGYYEDMIVRYEALVDLPRMVRWLEAHFPRTRIDRYVVVLSPLVHGSHNTRTVRTGGHATAYMFVAGPDLPVEDDPLGYREAANERLVFTEIDHNYVNPETSRVRRRVDDLLAGELDRWNRGEGYGTAYRTFNEYMTWSVFLLYAEETYSRAVADAIRARVVRQMEEGRGFPLFGEVHRVIASVWEDRPPGTPFAELYPEVLARLEARGASNR